MKEIVTTTNDSDSGFKFANKLLMGLLIITIIAFGYIYWKMNKTIEEVRNESTTQVEKVTHTVDSLLSRYTVLLDSLGAVRDTVIEKQIRYHTKFVDRWRSVQIQKNSEELLNSLEKISKEK